MRLLHYSEKRLGTINSVYQYDHGEMKPQGLWVSVEGDDDWLEWCTSNEYQPKRLKRCQEIRLKDDHNICILDSVLDIHQFADEYRTSIPGIPESRILNGMHLKWSRVAEQYKGIIIAPYQWECRMDDKIFWYYSWDCASGCIWDASAIAKSLVVK